MTDDLHDRIGRAAHDAAKRVLVAAGAPDHPLGRPSTGREWCCNRASSEHSSDMADWAALPEDRRAFYRAVGMAGYEMGHFPSAHWQSLYETERGSAEMWCEQAERAEAEAARLRGELEQECNFLRDKCAELLDGKLTLCAAPSCNRFLGPRLAMGYATCSEHCTKMLQRALLGRYAPLPTQRRRLKAGPALVGAAAHANGARG